MSSVPPSPHRNHQPVLSPETHQAHPACSCWLSCPVPLVSDTHRGSPPCLPISTTQVPVWAAPGPALTLPSLSPAGGCSRGLSDLSWFIAHILLVQNPPVCVFCSIRRAYKTGPSVLPGAWSVPCPLKPWAESALAHSVYLCVGACCWRRGGTSLLSLRVCDTPEVKMAVCVALSLAQPSCARRCKGLPVGLSRRLLSRPLPLPGWAPWLRSSLVLSLRAAVRLLGQRTWTETKLGPL